MEGRRVAVGGFSHETNTYSDGVTGLTARSAFVELRGAEILDHHAGAAKPGGSCVGGFISAAQELGAAIVPTFHCEAGPSGTVSAEAFAALKGELLAALAAAAPFDAVALDLHGAGVAEGAPDLEGTLVAAVRALVGDDIPIVAPLDLHGNITATMAASFSYMCGYHLNPHTDCFERGHEAFMMLPRLLSGEVRPACFVEHVPMLIPPTTTDTGAVPGRDGSIGAEMNAFAFAQEADVPGVLDCTVFHGFFKSDTQHVGVHVVCTVDLNSPGVSAALAQKTACSVGSWVWERRDRFRQSNLSPTDAVAEAAALSEKNGTKGRSSGGPVVLHEISDNPGSGAPGNATHLLRALVDADLPSRGQKAVFGYIWDPAVAAAAHAAGVGATIRVSLGGHHAPEICGYPLEEEAEVVSLSDGRWVLTAFTVGVEQDVGPMAGLRIRGVDVLVSSLQSQTLDTSPFILHGLDVADYDLVALKSAVHFRAGFRDIASEILPVDAPGLSTTKTETFARQHQAGPLWGKDADEDVEYLPSLEAALATATALL